MPAKKYVQSVIRGLDILRLLSEADEGLGVNDVADAINVANPTAHSLLQTLVLRGFAKQHGTRYFLGGETVQLFENYVSRNPMIHLKEGMLELAKTFPEAIIGFAELQAEEVALRFRISPDRPGIIQTPIKTRYLLYYNLSAMVMQAFLPENICRRLRQLQPFDEFGKVYWRSPGEFEKHLDQIRKDGYLQMFGSDNLALRIAAPVWNYKHNLAGVLSISLLWDEVSQKPTQKEQDFLLRSLCAKAKDLSL
ncbi:MAG: helix-turn-helix domain-containing protein [Victivallaceae bacterium]